MLDWRARKWRKHVECLIYIANNVLGALQWHIKHSTYLVENYYLEVETDEEYLAVNGIHDIVVGDIKK